MTSLTAVVLGATGLTGEQLVQQLLNDPAFSKVRILVRRPLELLHPKLEIEITDFDNLALYRENLGQGDCIFCCIGTTNNKVKGDKVAYRKIDFDIPVNAAWLGKDAGFTHYLLISSVGANAASANFYLRLKGEVEREIEGSGFRSFDIFRPGILFGKRKEFRLGEIVGKGAIRVLSFLLLGSLKKYKGIEVAEVAKAMLAAAKYSKKGMVIHHYADMMK